MSTHWHVHPTSLIADDTDVAEGSSIGPFCVIGLDGQGGPCRFGIGSTIRSHSVVYRGTVTGAHFHAGHGVLIREETMAGDDVSVGSHCVIEHHVRLEDGVRLHSGCFVPELSLLETGCWLGPGVIVTNAKYPNLPDTKARLQGVRIGQGAVIGAGAVLLPGISIGARAVVGAGGVVVSDVGDGQVVVGNPARPS